MTTRRPTSGWDWFVLGILVLATLALMFGGQVFGQGGDPRPSTQTVPIMGIDTQGRLVLIGDLANHALRVNVVAGSGGGPSGTIGTPFPSTVAPAGAVDAGGFTASLTVTNAGFLNVTCNNCSSSAATFAQAFPANGGAVGFKDGGGMMASGTVDNAGNLFVIASQSASSWTVIATGTITAHQGDTWTVNCSNCSGASTTNYGSVFPAAGSAIGFKDGAGRFASATVDNTGTLLVIASQGTANAIPWNINVQQWLGSTAPTVGQKTMANSIPVVIASDQSPVAATGTITAHQGDTWTVIATGTITAHQGDAWTVTANQGTSPWVISGTVTTNAAATFAAIFPAVGTAAGFRDSGGFMASATVTNNNAFMAEGIIATGSQAIGNPLRIGAVVRSAVPAYTDGRIHDLTLTTIGSVRVRDDSVAAYAALLPALSTALGFRDSGGFLASATVTNNNAFMAEGIIATNSQALGNPLRIGAVAQTSGRSLTDGKIGDLSLTTTSDLRVRADTSAATNTIAPSRVQIMGGWGQQATATQVTICDNYATVSLVQTGNVEIITSGPADQIKICSIVLVTASATAVGIFEGRGTLCNTNRTGVIGSFTTANGVNLATNGGFTLGNGAGVVARTLVTGNNVCLGNSTAASVAGGITWTKY